VWGLGCDPLDEAAVMRLLAIKQRAPDKGLILVGSQLEQLRPFVDIVGLPAERLAEVLATWPGPHTWIMPAASNAPRWITGAHDGIAVRISAHPQVVELCNAFGGALVSTSANRAGQPAPSAREALDPALVAAADGVAAGETSGLSSPTAIRDAVSGQTLRA
jgi:L-threonylcarbamoyladenylate synthase